MSAASYNTYYKLLNLFTKSGRGLYTIGEPLTILQHSIECGKLALSTQNPSIITAALLHDTGHIIKTPIDPDIYDDKHELIGSSLLASMGFPDSVIMPIKLHVNAKRYLCYKHPLYELSSGSKVSLQRQGGVMSRDEAILFEKNKYFKAAIELRQYDDSAKSTTCHMQLSDFRPYILHVLKN